MRREWRNVLAALLVFPMGTGIAFAQQVSLNEPPGSNTELVRMTLEVSWGITQNKGVSASTASEESDDWVAF